MPALDIVKYLGGLVLTQTLALRLGWVGVAGAGVGLWPSFSFFFGAGLWNLGSGWAGAGIAN